MNKAGERLYNGIIKENPTFVLMLGMCPTLAVTTSAMNGLGMGLTTAVVLTMSNLIISLLRKVIPSRVRIPAFIVIIASFVTAVQLLLQAYLPSLNDALGVYIPLIVVNVLAVLTALQNYVKNKRKLAGKDYEKIQSGCGHDCLHCGESGCSERFYDTTENAGQTAEAAVSKMQNAKAAADALETIDLDKEDK